jgi:uncharacterized delta-60 repeat protein
MTRAALTSLLALALFASGLAVALAAPGDPDPGFGTSGKRVLDYGGEDSATDVVVQPDGKVLTASYGGDPSAFQITRLDPDGSPDAGFGAGGTATPDFGALGGEYATAMALGPDGKVVVVGLVDNGVGAGFDVAVLRLLANGQPDASFDGDGMLIVNLGESETADAVAVKPDGGIVVGGTSTGGLLVMSLTATGANDPGFNNGTPLQFNPVPQSLFVFGGGMVRLPDGSLVLATTIQTGEGSAEVALARLTPTGSLDPGFAGDGVALHDLGGDDFAGRIALQPDGKLVMAARTGAGGLFSVARFTSDGAIDAGFGNGGRVGVDVGGTPPADVLVQANGKLLAIGYNDGGRATVMRVQPGGTLDSTFSGDGQMTDVFGGSEDSGRAGALQQNGGILIAGQTNANAVVARLQGDGSAGGPAPLPGGGPGGGGPGGGPGGGGLPQVGVPLCGGKRATIVGTARSDRLKGTRRADVIVALGGNDRVAGGSGSDLICAGEGNDKVDGGAGNDRLFGQAGRDALGGAGGSDLLDGGPGNDALGGGPGSDRLLGQAGRDRLTGGPGKGDRCAGNAGRDTASCERGRA